MMGTGMMGGGMGLWMIFNLFFWVLIIVGIVLVVAWVIGRSKGPEESSKEESALDILKKRYAKGEIGKEEFEEKKRDLL